MSSVSDIPADGDLPTPEDLAASPKAQEAKQRFLDGANCAQAVLCSFARECDLPPDLAARLATGFGAGMGRLREVCGAVSAMVIVAGLRHGGSPGDKQAKDRCYQHVQQLAGRFRQQAGSVICRQLLGLPEDHTEGHISQERTADYYRQRQTCLHKVMLAAAILERQIQLTDK